MGEEEEVCQGPKWRLDAKRINPGSPRAAIKAGGGGKEDWELRRKNAKSWVHWVHHGSFQKVAKTRPHLWELGGGSHVDAMPLDPSVARARKGAKGRGVRDVKGKLHHICETRDEKARDDV